MWFPFEPAPQTTGLHLPCISPQTTPDLRNLPSTFFLACTRPPGTSETTPDQPRNLQSFSEAPPNLGLRPLSFQLGQKEPLQSQVPGAKGPCERVHVPVTQNLSSSIFVFGWVNDQVALHCMVWGFEPLAFLSLWATLLQTASPSHTKHICLCRTRYILDIPQTTKYEATHLRILSNSQQRARLPASEAARAAPSERARKFPSAKMPLEQLLSTLPLLKPRTPIFGSDPIFIRFRAERQRSRWVDQSRWGV